MRHVLKTIAVAAVVAAISTAASAADLTGAGGTAIYPVLSVWAQNFQQKTGTELAVVTVASSLPR